jgi:hypothetical protein
MLGSAYLFGTVSLVLVFVNVFWEYDIFYFLLPLPAFYGLAMAVGAAVGLAVARVATYTKRRPP